MRTEQIRGEECTNKTTFTFYAEDLAPLCGTWFEPSRTCTYGSCPAVLIAGALAVPQKFYAPFAAWLAAQGYRVMTFDVRGIGASRQAQHRRSLRGLNADMLTWARQDFSAAVREVSVRHAQQKIVLVGHSLGVQFAAMTDKQTQSTIAHVVSVAAGVGHWRTWAAPSRRAAPLIIYLASPLLTPLFGYFPGKRLRMLGDLPAPVMRQWMRWCCHRDFAWGAEPDRVVSNLASARFSISAFSFTDDEAMTESCTRALLSVMPNAPSQLRIISPADVGLSRIGHLGVFRAEAAAALWPVLERAIRI